MPLSTNIMPSILPLPLLAVLLLCASLPTPLRAQRATPAPTDPNATVTGSPFWRAELPGGVFVVALRSITSVSSHEYLADNVLRVTEVTVATTGSLIARFYFQEPVTPNSPLGTGQMIIDKVQEKLQEGLARTGQEELWKKVVKTYPTVTHAHTVDYRVNSKDELDILFKSVETAWRTNRGANVTLSK